MSDDKAVKIELAPGLREQIDKSPGLAEAMAGFEAQIKAAGEALARGEYATMDDAIEGVTGMRPEPLTPEQLRDAAETMSHTDMPPVDPAQLRSFLIDGGSQISIEGGVRRDNDGTFLAGFVVSGIPTHARAVAISRWLHQLIADNANGSPLGELEEEEAEVVAVVKQ